MPTVVGISFKPVTKIYYFDPGTLEDLQAGDYVVVETSQGQEIGQVVWQPRDLPGEEITGKLKPVVRRASAVDLVARDRLKQRQREALEICHAKVAEAGLPMKVVGAEFNHDGKRLVVTFTAEGRIDFRDLVRNLARTFRTRIEMKQIGVRDEAKVLDGMGKCGRQLCCAGWLREFNPVTIKMAKLQNLPLNPAEISGVCGRLLCCLAYEMPTYTEARKSMPKVGSFVVTPEGRGRVRKIHALKQRVTVRLEADDSLQEYALEDLSSEKGATAGRPCGGCTARQPQPGDTAAAGESDEASVEGQEKAAEQPRRSRRRRRKPRNA